MLIVLFLLLQIVFIPRMIGLSILVAFIRRVPIGTGLLPIEKSMVPVS